MKIKIKGDVLVDVPDDLSMMTPYVLLEQEDWFESEIKFVRRMLQPGMKVIDVGANYGTYTLTAAKLVGVNGSVLAFEPASKTADYLKRSIELNSFGNICLLQCALSDHDGEASLSLSENSELNTLQQTAGTNCETVRLRTLDDCYTESGLGPIDFFKLDAEGEEIRILAGASKFLKQQSPLIMFELKHGNEVNAGLIKKFEQLGYKIFALIPGLNMLAPFDSNAPIDPFQLNLFACKDDCAEVLEERDLLATSIDGELPQHHSDKNLWGAFLKDKLYGSYFLPLYDHLRESEVGDWPVYRHALNDYVSSHLPSTPGRQRLGFLARSVATMAELLDGKPATYARLCTWTRVATEAGKRGIAANLAEVLVNAIDAGQITLYAGEPFLPASERFDSLDPVADSADWCLSSVIEAASRLRGFSSYFSDAATLPMLEKLSKSRYQCQEMERRRQLLRIRSGLQHAPEHCPALMMAGPENLNSEFWISRQTRFDTACPSAPQSLPVDQILPQAIAHHQAGRLQEAEHFYRAILQTSPELPDANHNLGVLLAQSGQYMAGLSHLKAALETDPSQGQFWLSYADALLASGQAMEALIVIQTAMKSGLDTPVARTLLQKTEAATQDVHATNIPETSEAKEKSGAKGIPVGEQAKLAKSLVMDGHPKDVNQVAGYPPQAELNQLIDLFNTGRFTELESHARLLLEQQPDSGFAWKALGLSLQRQGKDALPALQKAAQLLPDEAEAHNNLGSALQDLGQPDEAVSSYRRVLEIKPDFAEAHNNLGNALRALGQLDGAVTSYRQAVEIKPDYAEAHINLGIALQDIGQHNDAVASYRRALEIKPDCAETHYNLGITLQGLGLINDAVASYRRALKIKPDYVEAHNNLGVALQDIGQLDDAVTSYRRALEIKPDYADAHYNLGRALKEQGQVVAAQESYRRALKINPDYVEALNNLGILLKEKGEVEAALACCRQALEIKPDYAEAHNNLAIALNDKGEFNAAQTSYRRALEIKPDYAQAHSNMLLSMQYTEGYTQEELFAEHLAYAQCFEVPLKKQRSAHPNSLDSGKRLKIGYVSPDFRKHSVAYFIESVLAHHDREQVDVYCYCNNSVSDEVTFRLKSRVEHWCDIKTMGDEEAAKQIRNDGIDILIDLAGHTAGNRLLIFASKPAPVQASWLGYPYTTGLSSVDYRISDIYADPVGMSEHYYSEILYRLPSTSTCYHPPQPSPDVGSLPALAQGRTTFGSFNNLTKVTPEVRALWARILLATPASRLMLKDSSLADMATRQRLVAEFAGYGIAEERLILAPRDATDFGHLDRYNQVDIGLDPFPYNGTTTSFEALWMGVPVVSMSGNSYASRMGVSILSNLELTELLADTPEHYLAIAARLAGDPERLVELRSGLRERMTNSPLTDGKRFTLDLEKAYREMWRTFVAKPDARIHN